MKFINKTLIALCASSVLMACVKEVDAPEAGKRPQGPEQLPALCDTDFVGYIDPADGEWFSDAQVEVYDGVSEEPLVYKVSDVTEDGYCILKGQVYNTSDMYFALYPAGGFSGFTAGVATVSASANQLADATRVPLAAAVTSDRTFRFSPMASYIRLEVLKENISSVSIKGADSEIISGKYQTTVYEPEIGQITEQSDEIIFTSEGDFIPKGEYLVQVLPGTYTGFDMVVTYTDGTTYSGNHIKTPVELGFGDVFKFGKLFDEYLNAPVITVDQVAFSSARVSWPASASAKSYNLYLDGQKLIELDGDASSYIIKNLDLATSHKVSLELVGESLTKMSEEKSFTTLNFWVVDKSRRHITVQWDETVPYPLTGSFSGWGTESGDTFGGRGYELAIYTDADCTQEYYNMYPFDGAEHVFGNSSWVGKVGGMNLMVPTRQSLGYLQQNTTYYVRVRTVDGVTLGSKVLKNRAGTSEWSKPLEVTTLPAHTQQAGEVIFADFDEFCWLTDRKNGCPGSLIDGNLYSGSVSGKEIRPVTMGNLVDKNLDVFYSLIAPGTSSANGYFDGAKFNAHNAVQPNYILKEGADLEGWHFSSNVRANMACVAIDRAQNRFVGTPALTRNLKDDELTPCVLTVDMGSLFRSSVTYPIYIKIVRDGQVITVKELSMKTKFKQTSPTANDYELDFSMDTYTVPMNLMKGDAVMIVVGAIGTCNMLITVDNFKITVSDVSGNGSLEIPDWGNDGDGLEM